MPRKKSIPQKEDSKTTGKQKSPTASTIPVPALFFLPEKSINRDTLKEVKQKVNITTNKELYVVMKSYGGDVYSAVRIIKHIHTKYDNVIGIVFDYSYSAAVFLLLGSSEIFVSPEGYIAPIDKPMEHSSSGESISTLDVTQSVSNLASFVNQTARIFFEAMRANDFPETISKKEAISISWKSAVELTKPMMEKIDPVLLQKCYRGLRIGMYYAIDLLKDYMLSKEPMLAYDIAVKLAGTYPSHGYAIFIDEMKRLGLVVKELKNCKDADKLRFWYDKIGNGIEFIDDIYA